jgi:hypothetical protein
MPSPIYSDLLISILDNDLLEKLGELAIPRRIAPGETRTFDLVLPF